MSFLGSRRGSSPAATLINMPPEILENIAAAAAMTSFLPAPEQPDSQVGMLYDFRVRPHNVVTPPSDLRSILLVCRRFNALLNRQANPRLYARVFRSKFDTAAIQRRFGNEAVSSVNLAAELSRRCTILKRIRASVQNGRLVDDELSENLWLAYLMMVENDGLNLHQLKWAQIEPYLALHHAERMLESAVSPGYPPETVDRALALHLVYLLTDPEQLGRESKDESDERLFVLRPFVFAAHKFDAYLAPWTLRNLPLSRFQKERDAQPSQSNQRTVTDPFLADLTPRSRACEIEYCGRRIKIAMPILAQGACFSFFMKVERDPAVIGMTLLDLGNREEAAQINGRKLRRARTSRSPLSLSSIDHDRDVARLLACTDPERSRGLPPLYCRGMFEGTWEGRFSFFDFDSYREMLAGRMRSLYEGPFGEQPQIWKIKERIVKLPRGELEGGKGSILQAGYPPRTDDTDLDDPIANTSSDKGKGRAHVDDDLQLPADWDKYPRFDEDDEVLPDVDEEQDRYELLLSGTGHSAWGRFVLRGRIRTWDGMLIVNKEYRPDGRGRWLYRGYSVAGGKFVGRWRDTFTPDNMSGYEGCFLLNRREAN